MTDLPLHRKYRPSKLSEIVGNNSTIASLESILKKSKDARPTTYLFQGPKGCGKTTLARILAYEFDVGQMDLKEYNVSKQSGIAAARLIIDGLQFSTLSGKSRVFIFNETQGGDKKARENFQNALLETLEEPPKNTYFILCTTEPEKLLLATRDRCTTYQVTTLTRRQIGTLLARVIEEEGKDFPQVGIREIAKSCDGSPRQALVILDSVIDIEDEEKVLEAINDFSVASSDVMELYRALIREGKRWKTVKGLLKSLDKEPEDVRYGFLGYLTTVLLNDGEQRISDIGSLFEGSFMYSKKFGLTNACFLACKL